MSTGGLAARRLACDLLGAVLSRRRQLDEALEAQPELDRLDERDRGFVRLLVATVLRRLGQIDAVLATFIERPLPAKAADLRQLLRLGTAQLLFLDTPPHAAVTTTVELAKERGLHGFAALVNAVLRRVDRDGRALAANQDAARLNTPDWLWLGWSAAYGEAASRAIALQHLAEPPLDLSLRDEDAAAWAERLGAALLPTGTLRLATAQITQLAGFDEGAWWVQDAAAALPARLLGAVSGQRIADLCAAPGGKTAQLAAAGAQVTAVDRSARRLDRLADNLRRLRLSAEIVAADAARWRPAAPFDAVLLDAPCSATGTLRRHPDAAWLKSPADVAKLATVQAALLRAALAMVRPGGLVIYCVCSLQPEEGPERIAALLAETAAAERVPVTADEIGLAEAVTPAGDLRTLPCFLGESGGMDGFYAARLRRL